MSRRYHSNVSAFYDALPSETAKLRAQYVCDRYSLQGDVLTFDALCSFVDSSSMRFIRRKLSVPGRQMYSEMLSSSVDTVLSHPDVVSRLGVIDEYARKCANDSLFDNLRAVWNSLNEEDLVAFVARGVRTGHIDDLLSSVSSKYADRSSRRIRPSRGKGVRLLS